MSWQTLIGNKGPVWRGVEMYADERIAELTAVCVDPQTTDAQWRAAQAGIAEIHRLKGLPDQIRASAEISKPKPRREY